MNESDFDPVSSDIPNKDDAERASLEHLTFENHGKKMFGLMFRAQGRGPHPAALILHGFPGHDRNLDIAHSLRRGGMNTVVFHYRGSWGSEGSISFSNMLEDVRAVVDQLLDRSAELFIDEGSLTLVGHSMGGWAALMTAAEDPRISNIVSVSAFDPGFLHDFLEQDDNGRVIVKSMLEDLTEPLVSVPVNEIIVEVEEHGRQWSLAGLIDRLKTRSVLMIGAEKDTLSMKPVHFDPVISLMRSSEMDDLEISVLDTDHSYSDSRIALQRIIWNFLKERI